MTSSASGASTLDIREGDLVKATHHDDPDLVVTGRAKSTPSGLVNWVYIPQVGNLYEKNWDFEVLERPIDPELLEGAISAFRKGNGYTDATQPYHISDYRKPITAVIEYLSDYYNKENA